MIIWGLKKKIIDKGSIQTVECHQCSNRELGLRGLLRYLHIFWIPVFTIQKKTFALCRNCNLEFDKKSLPESLYKELDKQVFTGRVRLLYNFGILSIFIVTAIFAFYVISLM